MVTYMSAVVKGSKQAEAAAEDLVYDIRITPVRLDPQLERESVGDPINCR